METVFEEMSGIFSVDRKSSMKPGLSPSTLIMDELISIRVGEDFNFSFQGNVERAKCTSSREDWVIAKLSTVKIVKKCNCGPILCCKACGKFMSFAQILANVDQTIELYNKHIELENEQIRIKAAELKDLNDQKVKSFNEQVKVAEQMMQCFTDPLRRLKGNITQYTQFEAVYNALHLYGKMTFIEKKFYQHITSELKQFKNLLQQHYERLVLHNTDKFLSSYSERLENLDDYISHFCTSSKNMNFTIGDEFSLKFLASIFNFEAIVFYNVIDKPNCFIEFNAFAEFEVDPSNTTKLVFAYYGGDIYQVFERVPPRSIIALPVLGDNVKTAFSELPRNFSFHDATSMDLDTSFLSLVDDLAHNDDEVKEELRSAIVPRSHLISREEKVKLGSMTYAPDTEFMVQPIMNDLFRDINGLSEDPMNNLCNAISIACEGKLYVSYLLETAVTALYFCKNPSICRFRDHIDWLQYIDCIKLVQINKYYLRTNHVADKDDSTVKEPSFRSIQRVLNNKIDKVESSLQENIDPELKTTLESELMVLRADLVSVKIRSEKKSKAWEKFKTRLNRIMWEIVCELWKIWYGLTRLTEAEREEFIDTNDSVLIEKVEITGVTNESVLSVIKYTDNASMEDFHQLITTYKSVYNSRKVQDLPKNAAEAQVKHEEMKEEYASLMANKVEQKGLY